MRVKTMEDVASSFKENEGDAVRLVQGGTGCASSMLGEEMR